MVKLRPKSVAIRRATLVSATFLGVILFFWLLLRIPTLARVYARVEAGLVRVGTNIGTGLIGFTRSEKSLLEQLEVCEATTRTLAREAVSVATLEQEITELRALLGYTTKAQATGLSTHVIARAVDNDVTRVLIDKGELDGVQTGSAVVIDDGVLFGMIESVRQTNSVVRLVTSPQSRIPAAVLGANRTIGLVEGRQGAVLIMDFIPQDAELGTGNLVVTSGLDGLVREGLIIGLVTEVVAVESAPFQHAFIELLYEPREWTSLLILPPPTGL